MSQAAVSLPPVDSGDLSSAAKQEQLIQLVVDSVSSEHSKRAYRIGLAHFFRWWKEQRPAELFSRPLIQGYRFHLEQAGSSPATINQRLAPIRKLAEEAALVSLLPSSVAATIRQVKGAKHLGVRVGHWLTREQAQQLLALPDQTTLKGKRDLALLSLLLGAGLGREELAHLCIEDIQQRDGRWCVVDLEGKGKRLRTVPIPTWAKEALDRWWMTLGIRSGPALGSVNKGGRFTGQGMTASAIYDVVRRYEKQLQVAVRPHDLRRTYGKLAHKGGARIEQIRQSYGHASIQTTERYLGIDQDLVNAPCDFLGL